MSRWYHLVEQQAFGEKGLDAEEFACVFGPDHIVNGDLLVEVPNRSGEMYGVLQRIIGCSSIAGSADIDIKLVVAPVKLGRVSNIVGPSGARQTFVPPPLK